MNKSYNKAPYWLLLVLSVMMITNSACPTCKDTLALCDLAIDAFTVPSSVTVGQAFNAVTDVTNEEAGGNCTTTDIAGSTLNLLQVFFDDGSGFDLAGELSNIAQGELNPGNILQLLQSLTLNQTGDYRFDYYDDDATFVDERNEGNNYDSAYGRSADHLARMRETNNYKSVYIKVLPLPDGTTKIEGRPIVEFH